MFVTVSAFCNQTMRVFALLTFPTVDMVGYPVV